jgi:hypothetical protein
MIKGEKIIAILVVFLVVCLFILFLFNFGNETLVVSLTTSPTRISKIKPMLDSVMAQTYKPDRIILNLPKVFGRTGDTFALPLPDFITNNPLIQVNFCDDLGPSTKIISSIPLVSNPNTYIISVDDDIYYPPYLFSLYMKYSRRFPNCIITGTTFIENGGPQTPGKVVDFLEGFSGVLYRRDYFSQELLSDFYKHINEKSCRLGDDFYLSNLFKKWNRKIVSVGIDVSHHQFNPQLVSPLEYGLKDDALHKRKKENDDITYDATYDGNHNNYRVCTKLLDENGDLYMNSFRN